MKSHLGKITHYPQRDGGIMAAKYPLTPLEMEFWGGWSLEMDMVSLVDTRRPPSTLVSLGPGFHSHPKSDPDGNITASPS
jgi:hypothetical protein